MWQSEQQLCLQAAQRTISERLRSDYEPTVTERLPEALRVLLQRLESAASNPVRR